MKLSKEFGLNPTIPICFICGKPRNEIALVGDAIKEQMPIHALIDLKPCDDCQKHLEDGIALVEAEIHTKKGKEIPVPTGDAIIITINAFKQLTTLEIPEGHIAFVEKGILDAIRERICKREDCKQDHAKCPDCVDGSQYKTPDPIAPEVSHG